MKKKYLAAILGIMMATASVTACGAATTETTTNTAESSDNKGTCLLYTSDAADE